MTEMKELYLIRVTDEEIEELKKGADIEKYLPNGDKIVVTISDI